MNGHIKAKRLGRRSPAVEFIMVPGRIAALAALVSLVVSVDSLAATLSVGQRGGFQYSTIQAAVNAAATGDVIEIAPGTYNERVTIAGKAVTLRGIGGPSVTTINANGLAAGAALVIGSTVPAGCLVTGLAIQGATGAGVEVTSCSPTLRDCWIQSNDNSTMSGGGGLQLSGTNATLRLEDCSFTANQAIGRDGGALWLSATNSTVIVQGCEFVLNESTGNYGGAIYAAVSSLQLLDCDFNLNAVNPNGGDRRGGAIYVASGAAAITGCTFRSNFVHAQALGGCGDRWGRGGAIGSTGALVLNACNFFDNIAKADGSCNTALGRGGALWIGGGALSAQDCVFARNKAVANHGTGGRDSRGGALLVEGGVDPVLLRCNFEQNIVEGTSESGMNQFGGTLCYEAGSAGTITDCIIAGSSCGLLGGGVFLEGTAEPIFRGTVIRDCSTRTAQGKGGGVYMQNGADASFEDCRFSNCVSANGGGLHSVSSAPSLNRCVFDHNFGTGSAISSVGSGIGFVPTVRFTTLCSNEGENLGAWIAGSIIEPNPASNSFVADCGADCNANGVLDTLEIAQGVEQDCDGNQVPDSCQPDCDGDGTINACEILAGAADCDGNGVPDSCQLAQGAPDVNRDGVLDSCVPVDFVGLRTEIVPIVRRAEDPSIPTDAICYRIYAEFTQPGSRVIGIFGNAPQSGPNSALVVQSTSGFYNTADLGDVTIVIPCNLTSYGHGALYDSWLTVEKTCLGGSSLLNPSGFDFTFFSTQGLFDTDCILMVNPDLSQGYAGKDGRVLLAQLTTVGGDLPTGRFNILGTNSDGSDLLAYGQSWPAPDLVDCNGNGVHDAYDIRDGSAFDCDESGIPDTCEYALPNEDCNGNGTPDLCDIYTGASADINRNNVPDECECAGDVDGDGTVNVDDIVAVILAWGDTGSTPADLNGDFVVDMGDLTLVLNYYGQCQ